jgi:hypothetical protein
MKKMLKVIKTQSHLIVKLVSKNNKTERIYINASTIDRVKIGENVISKDCNDFIEISQHCNNLEFRFTILDVSGGSEINVKGTVESIKINLASFINFYKSAETTKNFLEVKEKIGIETKIHATNFKAMIKTKVKRSLIKQIMYLAADYYHDELIIGNDWEKDSFSFQKMKNGNFGYNGGIILHTDSDGRQYYSVHT